MKIDTYRSRDGLSKDACRSTLRSGDGRPDGYRHDCDDSSMEENHIIETTSTATMAAAESVDNSIISMTMASFPPSNSNIRALISPLCQPDSHSRRTREQSSNDHHRRTKTMTTAPFLSTLLLLLSTSPTSHAATETNVDTPTDPNRLCSCSPRLYTFKLNLKSACPPLPPPYPPNDVFGAGVKDYTCTVGPEPVDSASNDMVDLEELEFPTEFPVEFPEGEKESEEDGMDALKEEPVRRWLATKGRRSLNGNSSNRSNSSSNRNGEESTETIDLSDGFTVDIPVFSGSEGGFNNGNSGITDFEPVVIDSIQFIEVDPQFNVINQDPSFVTGIAFENGQEFNYTSVSFVDARGKNATTGSVPGGMSMVLRGTNKNGERLRNVYTITYTNDCNVETFNVGDAIGWVEFEDFLPASESTCDAFDTSLAPTPYVETAFPTENTPAPTPVGGNTKTASPTPYGKLPDSPTPEPTTVVEAETPAPTVSYGNVETETPTTYEKKETITPTTYGETMAPTAYGNEYSQDLSMITLVSLFPKSHKPLYKPSRPSHKPKPTHSSSGDSSSKSSKGSKNSKNSKRGGDTSSSSSWSSSSSSWKSSSSSWSSSWDSSWSSSWSSSSKSGKSHKGSKSFSSHSSPSSNESPAYHWRHDDDDYSRKYYYDESVRRLRAPSQNLQDLVMDLDLKETAHRSTTLKTLNGDDVAGSPHRPNENRRNLR